MKYTECKKIVQKLAFEKAIAVDHTKKSVADKLDIDAMGMGSNFTKNQLLTNNLIRKK